MQREQRRRLWIARLLLIAAALAAISLADRSISERALSGCGPQADCSELLSSHWAYWLGIPVSVPAGTLYLALLLVTFAVAREQPSAKARALWLAGLGLSSIILAAAVWFLGLQLFVIGRACLWCVTTHVLASAGAGMVIYCARNLSQGYAARPPLLPAADFRRWLPWSVASGMGLLVFGQFASEGPAAPSSVSASASGSDRDAASAERSPAGSLTLHGGRFKLNPKELPLRGSAEAASIVVSLFDYTCRHCRDAHGLLARAIERYSGSLAIISLPMPLDATCNALVTRTLDTHVDACQYARLGLAVFRAQPQAFREFDDWMFAPDVPPPLEHAQSKAAQLVGAQALEDALAEPWVEEQLQSSVALYEANAIAAGGDTRVPQIVIGDVVARGPLAGADELFRLLERHTPLGGLQALSH
jgi:uncharacterized membrane protein